MKRTFLTSNRIKDVELLAMHNGFKKVLHSPEQFELYCETDSSYDPRVTLRIKFRRISAEETPESIWEAVAVMYNSNDVLSPVTLVYSDDEISEFSLYPVIDTYNKYIARNCARVGILYEVAEAAKELYSKFRRNFS